MYELGLKHNKPHKKSARVVGHVLGFYHPHSDASVYDAMIRMAQNFTMKYPLVDGHGNVGSRDGDSPAAMRYTEAKMSGIGESMLQDINKDTVEFISNFDNTTKEPSVLPTYFPNLLANGSTGIAVGMSCSIPPHNVYDIYKAIDYILKCTIEGEDYDEDEIIDIVKAPDFPTEGIIVYDDKIKQAYKTGRGSVTVKARCKLEKKKNRYDIVVTEIPYGINKARLVSKIDEMRDNKRFEEIREIRDESNKDGLRIVIELKKDENPDLVLAKLYKYTQLQTSISMNFTVLSDNKPVLANLQHMLESFILHARQVLINKTTYDLEKAINKRHILEGIQKCLNQIDDVIKVIKQSKDNKATVKNLMTNFELTEIQAEAISETKLRALNKISKQDIKSELENLNKNINSWTGLLNNEISLLAELKSIFESVREQFKKERKTEIVYSDKFANITKKDLVKKEDIVITLTNNGLIKSTLESSYRTSNRNTKGSKSISIDNDDYVKYMFTTNTKSKLLIITDKGTAYKLNAYNMPIVSRSSKGKYINQYIELQSDEKILNVVDIEENDDLANKFIIMITQYGIVKKMAIEDIITNRNSVNMINFKDGDKLVKSTIVDKDNQSILIVTSNGIGLRLEGSKIRPIKSRNAIGVSGIKLRDNDYVVDMINITDNDVLLICANGIGKRVNPNTIQPHNRNTCGARVIKINKKTGLLVNVLNTQKDDTVLLSTKEGLMVKTNVKNISLMGKNASGVKIVKLNNGDNIVAACVGQKEIKEE